MQFDRTTSRQGKSPMPYRRVERKLSFVAVSSVMMPKGNGAMCAVPPSGSTFPKLNPGA